MRFNSYRRRDFVLSYFRTARGVEVDLIIETPKGEVIGVEIKSRVIPEPKDYESGFAALRVVQPKAKMVVVCPANAARIVNNVQVLPHQEFFKLLESV